MRGRRGNEGGKVGGKDGAVVGWVGEGVRARREISNIVKFILIYLYFS